MQYSRTSIADEYEYGFEDFSENAKKTLSAVKSVVSAIGSGLSKLFNKLSFTVAKLSKLYNLLFSKYTSVIVNNRHEIDLDKYSELQVKVASYKTNQERLVTVKQLFHLLENIETIVASEPTQLDHPEITKSFKLLMEIGFNINESRIAFKVGDEYSKESIKGTLEQHGYEFSNLISFIKDVRSIEKYASKSFYKEIDNNLTQLSSKILKENKQLKNIEITEETKSKYLQNQIQVMRIWWCSHCTKAAYIIATDIIEDALNICSAVIKLIPKEKVGSVFGSNESFINYYSNNIDISYEDLFNTTIDSIYKDINKDHISKLHSQFALSKLRDEEYRSIKKFIKAWSKQNKDIYNENIKVSLENRHNDYTLVKLLQKLNINRVNKNDFKLCIIPNTTTFVSMNARFALYNSVLNAVNSIDKIITEQDDTEFGSTLTKLLAQLDTCGFIINLENKYLSEHNTYIDIRAVFDVNSNKSLKDLDYTPHDVFRFAINANKLKTNIYKTGLFLQDRLKTQHDANSNQSENTTITGLLYYNLPNTDNPTSIIKNRLFRVSLLNSIFQAVCNYTFEVDYNSTINLLNTTIQAQQYE